MSISSWVWGKTAGGNAKRPHLAGAAFSKTWLIYRFSLVVGHGARPHRRGYDGGRRRGGWSGKTSWAAPIQPDGAYCQARAAGSSNEPARGSGRPRATPQPRPALSDQPYFVDIDSMRRAFAPGTEPPPLLLDFAAWLHGRPWGSVGCFDLAGKFSDAAPIVDGSPLRRAFALFMSLPEGSAVGAWLGADSDPLQSPIVVLGSEGQNEVLAPSLEGFLARIALRRFEDRWSDFEPHEDAEDATDELTAWLGKRLKKSLSDLAQMPSGLPDFGRWIEEWCRNREEFWTLHPILADLRDRLSARRPQGRQSWDRTHFEIAIAGRQFQAYVLHR